MWDHKVYAKTLIVATGTKHRLLNVPGESQLSGRGISWCAVCDGAFFRGKKVAVIGGGDSAIEEAIYLAGLVEKVTVIHRRDELRAQKIINNVLLMMKRLNLYGIQLLSHLMKKMETWLC